MYKARVEAVSGTKILAGGKWLQCIGNKTFHVGELAWTDGRCAYGNHYTPQQPLVITAQQDEGIPILINESKQQYLTTSTTNSTTNADYYILSTKGKIKKVDEQQNSEYRFLLNDTKARSYIANRFIGYSREVDVSASSERPYSERSITVAANIDKQGNFYEIRQAHRAYIGFDEGGSSYTSGYTEIVSIIKNGETLLEFDCEEYWNEIYTEVETVARELNTGGTSSFYLIPNGQTSVPWGVIENENTWAFILSVYAERDYETLVPIHEDVPNPPIWDVGFIHSYKSIMCAYLYTPNKIQKIWRGENGWYDTYYYKNSLLQDEDTIYLPVEITAPQIDEHIPIQDGYYFKINNLRAGAWKYSIVDRNAILPRFANISIFSPSDELLFTDEFAPGTYFTIYRGKFLGINDFGGLGLIGNDHFNSGRETVDIESGLYLIKDKKIEPILKGYICNWKLRPMKKIRGWQNRIRDLPTE